MADPASHEQETDSLPNLAQVEVGSDFRIRRVEGPGCDQLRRLGFCESLRVRKLADGRNLICSICGTRIAVSSDLAEHVKVSPVAA